MCYFNLLVFDLLDWRFGMDYNLVSRFKLNRAVKRSNCFHKSGGKDPCHMSSNPYMIAFGVTQILFSQIPDFDQIWWLSIVAAVMSFTYSSIGLGLGIAKVAGPYISQYFFIISQ